MIEWRLGPNAARVLERIARPRTRHPANDTLPEDRARALVAYGGRCAYCHAAADANREIVVDLLVPASRGGTMHTQNLVAACAPCSKARGGKHLDAFIAARLDLDVRAVYGRIACATAVLRAAYGSGRPSARDNGSPQ